MSTAPVKDSDKGAIIEGLKRELQDYKNIIENDNKIIDELHNEIDELKNSYEKLKTEFDEYKVRHPGNVGVKNGKTYEYKSEAKESTDKIKKKPGAVKGHKGYHRIAPNHLDRHIDVTMEQCPGCWNKLNRIVETRNIDETSWRINGKNTYIWALVIEVKHYMLLEQDHIMSLKRF